MMLLAVLILAYILGITLGHYATEFMRQWRLNIMREQVGLPRKPLIQEVRK